MSNRVLFIAGLGLTLATAPYSMDPFDVVALVWDFGVLTLEAMLHMATHALS